MPLAILAFVTCNAPICAVSILPSAKCSESIASSAILAPVTASAPNWSVVTCPSSMCFVKILFCAIFVPSTALSAILPEAIVFAAIWSVVI